jgi:hypothetical protein
VKKSRGSAEPTLVGRARRTRPEIEFEEALAASSTSAPVKRLLRHMLVCLHGSIPECTTCFDVESVKCSSGYTKCRVCGPTREARSMDRYAAGKVVPKKV